MAKCPSILSISKRKKQHPVSCHTLPFNPIWSSLMSFPCHLVLFLSSKLLFRTLSASPLFIPTFTITDPHIWHTGWPGTVWLTPGLPGKHPLFLVSAQLHWQWQLARASSLKWQRQHLNRHAKLRTNAEKPKLLSFGSMLLRGFFGGWGQLYS